MGRGCRKKEPTVAAASTDRRPDSTSCTHYSLPRCPDNDFVKCYAVLIEFLRKCDSLFRTASSGLDSCGAGDQILPIIDETMEQYQKEILPSQTRKDVFRELLVARGTKEALRIGSKTDVPKDEMGACLVVVTYPMTLLI